MSEVAEQYAAKRRDAMAKLIRDLENELRYETDPIARGEIARVLLSLRGAGES